MSPQCCRTGGTEAKIQLFQNMVMLHINLFEQFETSLSVLWLKYNLDINKTGIFAIQFYFLFLQ